MNETLPALATTDALFDASEQLPPLLPELPTPGRQRWQPLRLGLVELFHYDSEEFWFHDGHLLLRGNNGTGKSKVLSLTLPFLFDAQLRPARIEPDGDAGKKMAWNLLMNTYEQRTGYAWIEFGRIDGEGRPHILTLGAGLAAKAGRASVDSWYFILDNRADAGADGGTGNSTRIGRDLWLTNPQRHVLGRERLREALVGRGQVFDTGQAYRRAVDERLFHLGQKRYEALMDTLIQLRQPQLSRKPDEAALSQALTDSLPPLATELLADVAEALNQLEEDRRQLEEFQQLALAVDRFEQRYRVYTGTLSRRQTRELRHAQTEFDRSSGERAEAEQRWADAQRSEAAAQAEHASAELTLAGQRSRLETLQSDPTMQDANRLDGAQKEAEARRRAVDAAEKARDLARSRQAREDAERLHAVERAAGAEQSLGMLRAEAGRHAEPAGLSAQWSAQALATLAGEALAELAPRGFDTACAALRSLVEQRRDHLALMRRRHVALDAANNVLAQRLEAQREKQDEAEAAAGRRSLADGAVDAEGQALVQAWAAFANTAHQLRFEAEAPLAALSDWVLGLQGDNPARLVLDQAREAAHLRQAARQLDLDHQHKLLDAEQTGLRAEQRRLLAGEDQAPPAPVSRGPDTRAGRAGAPLWQLVDFQPKLDAPQRAGLEAALQASGLLDAWVTPDGALVTADGERPWLDNQWVPRPPAAAGDTLAGWLCADTPAVATTDASGATPPAVSAANVERLLAAIACGSSDTPGAEAWVSPDGRYRLGSLAGHWAKPAAQYVGFNARAAARAQRLTDIADQLDALAAAVAVLHAQFDQLAAERRQADEEWRAAPSDQALREAHLTAAHREREFQTARERLVQADATCRSADELAQAARGLLERDATDLRLPVTADALLAVETALNHFNDAHYRLVQAAQDWRRAQPELQQQEARAAEAMHALQHSEAAWAGAGIEAEEAQARLTVLLETVGAEVEALRAQLALARTAVAAGERGLKVAAEVQRLAGERRAVAAKSNEVAEQQLAQRSAARAMAVQRLQQFAATSLLASALPTLEIPELHNPWTIDPALGLARRAEQALLHLKDDDESWARVQRQTTADLTELARALTALGHQSSAETSDWGLVVHIVYQNRSERPDRLAARLTDEIGQRSELLTAKERTVLENHLQAEIAAEVQRLLQGAEKQVAAINRELHKRPTSTGVRYRLLWQPLAEGDGAPVGLEAARARLLNTSADLWSTEDRRVVGVMLQQRILQERAQADSPAGRDLGGDAGGLVDQLARALDYRRWHRFRVERWQDGHWRKLSGPASSGERALGLTVPLFAAVASFYSQGGSSLAPRLMLLDEAFAGIDDAARAHCMGLIREFDLDFVITSEREWACYAELPGVSICQLQRREGIDAVHVSRWHWDGRAKRREDDPDRRWAPAG